MPMAMMLLSCGLKARNVAAGGEGLKDTILCKFCKGKNMEYKK
jgi:hypothetical protein